MPKYSVSIPIATSMIVYVEAASAEEAIAIAGDNAETPCVCHQCAGALEVGDPLTQDISIDDISLIDDDDFDLRKHTTEQRDWYRATAEENP